MHIYRRRPSLSVLQLNKTIQRWRPPTPPVFRPISNPRCSRGACILAQELQLHQLCPKWWAEMDRVPSQLDAASMMRIASTHSSLCCGTIDCEEGDMQISHQEPARGIWDLFITPASSPPATAQGSPQQGHPRVGNDPPWLTHLAELAKAICFGCASDVAKSDAKLAAVQAKGNKAAPCFPACFRIMFRPCCHTALLSLGS